MADVFISYSSRDQEAARRLRTHLDEAGYSCWMAPDDIQGTRTWAEQILSAIEEAKVLVILVSGNSNDSSHVANEVTIAFDKKKAILPVRVEDVQPTGSLEYLLKLAQWVDAFPGPIDHHVDQLRRTLSALIVEAGGEAPKPAPTTLGSRVRRLFGTRSTVVASIAVGATVVVLLVVVVVLSQTLRQVAKPTAPADQSRVGAPSQDIKDVGSASANQNAKVGDTAWSFRLSGNTAAAALLTADTVYIGSMGNSFHALDIKTGQQKWSLATGGSIDGAACENETTVFFSCGDKSLYAVDKASGTAKWKFSTTPTGPMPRMWLGPPVYDKAGNYVAFGCADGRVRVLDPETGKLRSNFVASEPGMTPYVMALGPALLFTSDMGQVGFANAADGKVIARIPVDNSMNSFPVKYGDLVYVRTYDEVLHAIDTVRKKQAWSAQTGGWEAQNTQAMPTPAASDGIVCFPSTGRTLVALDAIKGTPKWKFKADGVVFPPAAAKGLVFFGTEAGTLYALDIMTGKELWKSSLGGVQLDGTPATGQGLVLISDFKGTLSAVKVAD